MLPSFKKKVNGGNAPKFVKVTWPFFYIKNSLNSGSFKICNLNFFCSLHGVSAVFWPELPCRINSVKAGVRHQFDDDNFVGKHWPLLKRAILIPQPSYSDLS